MAKLIVELLALVNSPAATKRKGGRKRTRKSVDAEGQSGKITEESERGNQRPVRAAKRGRKAAEKDEQDMDWVEHAIDSIVSDVTESSDAGGGGSGSSDSGGLSKSPKTLSRRSRQRLSACQMTPEEAAEAVSAYRASRARGHPYSCHLCGTRALNMGELVQHTCSAHYSAAVDKDALQESTVADCSVCMYIPPGQHGKLFAHVATVHGKHRDAVPSELADFLFSQNKVAKAAKPAATSSKKTATASAVPAKADSPAALMGPGDVVTLKEVPPASSGVLACFFCGAGIFQSRAQ